MNTKLWHTALKGLGRQHLDQVAHDGGVVGSGRRIFGQVDGLDGDAFGEPGLTDEAACDRGDRRQIGDRRGEFGKGLAQSDTDPAGAASGVEQLPAPGKIDPRCQLPRGAERTGMGAGEELTESGLVHRREIMHGPRSGFAK